MLDKFPLCSGLEQIFIMFWSQDREKTEVFPVNCNKVSEKKIEVVWKHEKFKSLGVWFTLDENEMLALNLNKTFVKLKNNY